jgi:hypothetical protein
MDIMTLQPYVEPCHAQNNCKDGLAGLAACCLLCVVSPACEKIVRLCLDFRSFVCFLKIIWSESTDSGSRL